MLRFALAVPHLNTTATKVRDWFNHGCVNLKQTWASNNPLFLLLLCGMQHSSAAYNTDNQTSENTSRDKISLTLSGGGICLDRESHREASIVQRMKN